MKKIRTYFNTSANEKIVAISEKIDELVEKRDRVLEEAKDIFSPLGKRAPFLREAFKNVALPVKTKEELLEKMGGKYRVIIAPSLDGSREVVAAADFIDSISPFLDKVLPVTDWDSLARQILSNEKKVRIAKKSRKFNVDPIIKKVSNKNLKKILDSKKAREIAFPNQIHNKYSMAFAPKLRKYQVLTTKMDTKEKEPVKKLMLNLVVINPVIVVYYGQVMEVIIAILEYIREQQERNKRLAETVSAKTSSAITHLTNVETFLNNADDYLENVLNADELTNTVVNYNNQAENALESASQLLSQAIADLAVAESTLQHIPDNNTAQNAVAEAQNKLEQVQNQYSDVLRKMAEAEEHKDMLSIPFICITIRCIETDPCCDDDWNGVTVRITNTSNTNVPEGSGTTRGNGSVTICGRFGNSSIMVETEGSGGWNVTKYYATQDNNQSFTIKTDLSGVE